MSNDVTPTLTEFLAKYEKDDNEWWRLDCGHHRNLFDDAVERLAYAREERDKARALAHEAAKEAYLVGRDYERTKGEPDGSLCIGSEAEFKRVRAMVERKLNGGGNDV